MKSIWTNNDKRAALAYYIYHNTQKLRKLKKKNTQEWRKTVAISGRLCYDKGEVDFMRLKELRIKHKLTQAECAKYLGIPIRTYQNYERDDVNTQSIKYLYMLEKLEKYGFIDEEHGILTLEKIKKVCGDVFKDYEVTYCYLFGSYAKGKATEKSDVDLLISTEITGIRFFELVEVLREKLKKKVDVLNQLQIRDNYELVNEILKDGIKIYG